MSNQKMIKKFLIPKFLALGILFLGGVSHQQVKRIRERVEADALSYI